jgi:hypothetical protein
MEIGKDLLVIQQLEISWILEGRNTRRLKNLLIIYLHVIEFADSLDVDEPDKVQILIMPKVGKLAAKQILQILDCCADGTTE